MNEKELYRIRFNSKELAHKQTLWSILCRNFFSKYIHKDDCVLDLAAGYCEFINNIKARKKIAVDINPDTVKCASPDVSVFAAKSTDMAVIPSNSVDIVFVSNFFEHISKDDILKTLKECERILNVGGGGKIIILQPNIKYVGGAYWDYFDHHSPLTEKSLQEALEMAGLLPIKVIPRFLPYTVKSKIPQYGWLIKLYLLIPFVWKIMGKQMLIIAGTTGNGKTGNNRG